MRILHTVDTTADPDAIYAALTSAEGLGGWWSKKVTADIRVGGVIEFSFLPDFNPRMEITSLEKGRHVAWKCVGGHDRWLDNTFEFRIEPRGQDSVLFFRQDYAREISDEEYGRYTYNWGYYLRSLKLLCETGTGTPYDPS